MFLAIINDTYSEVKSENVSSDIHIGSYLMAKCNCIVGRLAKLLPCLRKIPNKMREKRREKHNVDDAELTDLSM